MTPKQYNDKAKRQGWICPKCDNVYAPHVDCCHVCNDSTGKFPEEALEAMRDCVHKSEQESDDETEPSMMSIRPDSKGMTICAPCRFLGGAEMDPLTNIFNQPPENTEIDYNGLEGIDAESNT